MSYTPDLQFVIDTQACEIQMLEDRLNDALAYLLLPDVGYGLSPVGVENVILILRGEWEPAP